MTTKWEENFKLIMVVFMWVGLKYSNAAESIPANHNPRYKPDLRSQVGNSVSSGRVFVPAASSSANHANVVNVPNIAMSSLILESHHDVIPSPAPFPATRFAVAPTVPVIPTTTSLEKLASAVQANPVLAALLISSLLSVNTAPRPVAYNSPEHLPPDPYVALLLSHYGRYVPRLGFSGHGLYGYTAANNIHNTKPFGSYKIYEDSA